VVFDEFTRAVDRKIGKVSADGSVRLSTR